MIITREHQIALLQEYEKTHTALEAIGFVDGLNKAIEVINKELTQLTGNTG